MGVKRIKFLDRSKILQSDIEIRLEQLGRSKRFAVKLHLEGYRFPSGSRVFVDAKQLLERLRFDLGSVDHLKQGVLYDITRLTGERVTFDVLVVEPGTSRKLGAAETVRPLKAGQNRNEPRELLPVDASKSLDGPIWRVDYTEDWDGAIDAPVLLLDRVAAGLSAASFMESHAARGMILPAAMKEILTKSILLDEHTYDPQSRSWRDAWIRFASRFVGEPPPEGDSDNRPSEELTDWINVAVARFAQKADFVPNFIKEGVQ